jgi:pyruvate kinase
VDAFDALMIARGDLGVEIPVERIPRVQKELTRKANRAGKPVITATQMLRSMVENPRPTRAEVTDVANAVLDGTDAVMLSEETAVGHHPVESVEMMARIVHDAEKAFPFDAWGERFGRDARLSPEEAVARSACSVAAEVGAAAIVTLTQSGSTARLVAKYRPVQPILAVTPDVSTYRALSLVWGVVPVLIEPVSGYEEIERRAVASALASGSVRSGERIVVTAGLPLSVPGTTNTIKIVTARSE